MNRVVIRPESISVIALINGIASAIHILFWGLVFFKINSGDSSLQLEKNAIATIYGFGIADLLWSAPLLAVSTFGLWRMSFWGWLSAQWCNILYWYSLTVLFVRDFNTNTISPGGIISLPFAVFSIWAFFILCKERKNFENSP